MQHRLVPFETAVVVILGIVTLNIFTVIYHGLKHSRLPKVRPDDFSAGRAIGFLFIPFFNFYWIFVFWTRLVQRINFQFKLRGQLPPVAEELGVAVAILTILSMIPVLGIVTAAVNWLILLPILSAQIQSAANRLTAGGTTPVAMPVLMGSGSEPAPPPASPLAPPPPPSFPAAGPQLSRRTLAWIAGGVAALVTVIIVAARFEAPTDSAVRSFVKTQLAQNGFEIENVMVTRRVKSDKTITYNANITYRRSTESLYEALLPELASLSGELGVPGGVRREAYTAPPTPLPDWLPLDVALWKRVRTQLASPNSPRLKQAAGLTPEEEALVTATVVREIKEETHSASNLNFAEGTVWAVRRGVRWDLKFERQGFFDQVNGARRLLSAFRGKVLVLDRTEDRAALLDLAHRLPGINEKFTRAVAVLLAESKARWLALLKPQTLFAGTVGVGMNDRKRQATIYLEITETRADEDPPRLSVLLRNDGGWHESRLFAGRIIYDDTAGRFLLKLTSPISEAIPDGGPFLEDHSVGFDLQTDEDGDRMLPLHFEENTLVWKTGGNTLRLEPVREDARDTLIAGLQADHLKLQEATQPEKAYLGTITNRAKGTRETWLLRFNPPDEDTPEDGDNLSVMLEHLENRAWKGAMRGRLSANRYRANGVPLHLHLDRNHDSALSPPKAITDLFVGRDNNNDGYGPGMGLRLAEWKLVGENSRFVFEFAPATPEQVAGIEQKWADATETERRQLLEATRPGTIYRGTVTTRSGSRREEFLLRFLEPEDDGDGPQGRARRILRGAGVPAPAGGKRVDMLRARIEHPDHPLWRLPLTGRLQLDPEEADNLPVLLNPTGHTVHGKEARKNSFLDDNYEEISLRLDGAGLSGESTDYRLHFDRLAPEAAAQLQQREDALRTRLLAIIQPGAVHDGTVEVQNAKPGLLRLRFLKLENDGEKVEALLQSRLRPQFAWLLKGRYNLAEFRLELTRNYDKTALELTSDPELEQALRHFGNQLVLFWDEEAVSGYMGSHPGGWKFRFQPSSPEQLARLREEEVAREARLLAFVQPGALHDGTVERAGVAVPGLLRLRIVKMENRGERVEAVLQSRTRPRYMLPMTGKCDLSAGTLHLQWSGEPTQPARILSNEPDLRPHFRNFGVYNGSLVLSLDQNPVSGTHNNVNFRFQPSSSERLAELQKQEAARFDRALAFVQTGTVHEGTVTPGGNKTSVDVRLRILSMANRGERIEARLESAQRPQFAQKLAGRLALDGQLLLVRIERGPTENNGRILFEDPALQAIYPNGFFTYNEFGMDFTDTVLEGSLDGNVGPKLIFPLR